MGEVIADLIHLKWKENQNDHLLNEKAILKAREENKIRELYREICEMPEKPNEIGLRKKREIETEWGSLEESNEVNSAGRIDQLNALRFKTQSGNKNLSR